MILLSIITVTRNERYNLEKTLLSVIREKSVNVEYIVIDGDSSDGTNDLIKENIEVIDEFISEQDSGIYNAMNKGLKMASGKFSIFLNSGDEISNISNIIYNIKNLEYTDASILLYSSRFTWPNGMEKTISPEFVFCKMPTSHQAMVFHTDTARLFYYNENYKYSADYELYLSMSECVNKNIIVFNDVIVKTAPVGFTESSIKKYIMECYYINKKFNNKILSILRCSIDFILLYIKYFLHFILNDSVINGLRKIRGGKDVHGG